MFKETTFGFGVSNSPCMERSVNLVLTRLELFICKLASGFVHSSKVITRSVYNAVSWLGFPHPRYNGVTVYTEYLKD